MARPIKITKQNGEILGKDFILQSVEAAFQTLANGEFEIAILKIVKKRSLDQNRLMWLWFACIEKETGTPKEDAHDYYCRLFLQRRVTINGVERTVISGTSKLNTVQFTDFLNKIQADASSEFGIILPNPDDLRFKEFEEYYKNFI